MGDASQLVLISVSAALVAVHSLQLLFYLFGSRRLLRFLQSLLAELRGFLGQGGEEGKLAEVVASRMRMWQRDQLRFSATVLALIYFYQVVAFIASAAFGLGASQLTAPQLACVLLGYGEALLVVVWPRVLSTKTLDLWFLALLLPIVTSRSQVLCVDFICTDSQFPPRMLSGSLLVGRMDGRVSLLAGALYWILPLVVTGAVPAFFSFDALLVLCASLLSLSFKTRARQHLQRDVEAEFLQQRQQAFRVLLRNFYDVVLELDEELCLVGPTHDLAIFLLHGAGVSLEGRKFLHFLKEEDRQMVAERLQLRPSEEQGAIAEVVHARLRSEGCSTVDVELFCFGFESLASRGMCYVMGIREYSDELYGLPGKGASLKAREAAEEIAATPPLLEGEAAEEVAVTVDEAGEVAATVDTSDPDLMLLSVSANFQLLVGSAHPGSSLRERVCSGKRFSGWVQSMVNRQLADLTAEPAKCRVKFKPVRGVQVHAICSFRLVECSGEEGDEVSEDAALAAKLVFSEVERKRCRRASHSSGSSSGSSNSGCHKSALGLQIRLAGQPCMAMMRL